VSPFILADPCHAPLDASAEPVLSGSMVAGPARGGPEPRDRASGQQADRDGYFPPVAVPMAVRGDSAMDPGAEKTKDFVAAGPSSLPAGAFPEAVHWTVLCLRCFGLCCPH
jgi:hypothetical protein